MKKLGEAVKQATQKEERSKNIVMFGVAEEETQQLESQVEQKLQHIGQKPRIVQCCRLAIVKVTFSSLAIVGEVFRNAKLLKNAEDCQQIFICPDRTVEQIKNQKELFVKLRQLKSENPGAKYSIRSGQVVRDESLAP